MKLVLTQRSEYAARAIAYLAKHQDDLVPSEEIASATAVPKAALQQVLQALGRAQLVTSRTGVGGGYLLARSPGSCTLRQVVEAVEGPLSVHVCGLTGLSCAPADSCALHSLWTASVERFAAIADAMTIDQLAAEWVVDRRSGDAHSNEPRPASKAGNTGALPSPVRR